MQALKQQNYIYVSEKEQLEHVNLSEHYCEKAELIILELKITPLFPEPI